MMHYKHRWLGVLILSIGVFAMGVSYVLYPDWQALMTAMDSQQRLRQQLAVVKPLSSKQNLLRQRSHLVSEIKPTNVLSDVLTLAHLYTVTVKNVRFLPAKESMQLVHVVAQGDAQSIFTFVLALADQVPGVNMLELTYKLLQTNQLSLNLIFGLKKQMSFIKSDSIHPIKAVYHPFCMGTSFGHLLPQRDEIEAQSVTFQQMKMIGHFQRGAHQQALIMLPNARVIAVYPVFRLGKEQAVVTAIKPNQLQVALPNQTYQVLNMV